MLRFLFFLACYFSLNLNAQEQEYLWPTSASPYLSGTFGETRSAHFHSGLDIKTWGREGYKVFASKKGKLHRLAVTAQGYGRVIYLKHADSTYTVYAHLQRFNNRFQHYIDSVRLTSNQFEIDLTLDSLDIEVKQGDIIGYSGSTGIGPPHLHFEIRDKNERPINPLLTNLGIQDGIPPTFSALIVFPLSDTSTVEGSSFPRIYYPTQNSVGAITFGTVNVNGPFGIAVSNYDAVENVSNKYAVFEATLLKDQDTLFYSKIDSLDFETTETMFLDRIPALGASRRSYQTLFSQDGPPISFQRKNLRRLTITDSSSVYNIVLKDINGNESNATFTVLNEPPDVLLTPIAQPIHLWYWTNDWVTSGGKYSIDFTEPTGKIWNTNALQTIETIGANEGLLSRTYPNATYEFWSTDMDLNVRFNEKTFFDTLSVFSYTNVVDSLPYFAIHPANAPVRKKYAVQFYLRSKFESGNNYQLFWIDRPRDRLSRIPSKLIGRTIHATPNVLGEFVVMPDNDAPQIQPPELLKTSYGKWLIVSIVEDQLSGIDYTASEIKVNGVRAITEYDFEEDKLIYYHPDFTPQKKNRVEIIVTDNAGNSAYASYQI